MYSYKDNYYLCNRINIVGMKQIDGNKTEINKTFWIAIEFELNVCDTNISTINLVCVVHVLSYM